MISKSDQRNVSPLYAVALGVILADAAMTATIDNTWSSEVTPRVLFALQALFNWALLLIGVAATDVQYIRKFVRFAIVWTVRTLLFIGLRFPRLAEYATSTEFYSNTFLHVLQGVFQVFSVFFYVALMRSIS